MGTKMNKDETDIRYIRPYKMEYEGEEYRGIIIGYDSNIGWGEFNISFDYETQKIEVDSETRCNNEHKEELELILDKAKEYIIKNCEITG